MRDNPLVTLLIATIQAGVTAQGLGVGIKQSNQPTTQGVPTAPTVFIDKLFDRRYGFPERKYSVADEVVTMTETVMMETTFQCTCLVTQDPANQEQLTASDCLKGIAQTLQSLPVVMSLHAAQVGIQRIQQIRNTYMTNDKQQFEASPMLEFLVTHKDTLTTVVTGTKSIVSNIRNVAP